LPARLYGNAQFVSAVLRKLHDLAIQPNIVHANDHWEGILGIRLAKAFSARSIVFLRTSRLTGEDYFKYWCDRYQIAATIGPVLQARAQSWSPHQRIDMIYDGIEHNEFLPPIQKANRTPRHLLVIGAERRSKGWADFVEALSILEGRNMRLPERVDFTGNRPSQAENDLDISRVANVQFNFLGRIEGFRDLVRKYDLVVNPSRSDSFGMAAIETLAAGAPLLTSRTGVLEQVVPVDHMLFPPRQPSALADALERLIREWHQLDFGVAQAQELIRQKFPIEQSAAAVDSLYRQLISLPLAR
jgi:glycosyltransferase involved in cell wall biosynthesis